MRVLVDTHILIWMHSADKKNLSSKALEILDNKENDLFYSPVSVWEVYVKLLKHPNEFEFNEIQFDEMCRKAGIKQLCLKPEHILTLSTLKPPDAVKGHKDPMDRLLIAQAKIENLYLVSHDHLMPFYEEECIIMV